MIQVYGRPSGNIVEYPDEDSDVPKFQGDSGTRRIYILDVLRQSVPRRGEWGYEQLI